MIRALSIMAALAALAGLVASAPPPQAKLGPQPGGGFLLPTGWTLTPAGKQVPLGSFPMSMALSPDGKHLLVLNGGFQPPSISVVDVAAERETARVPVEDAWLGITFNAKGDRVFVGGGSRPFVFEFQFTGGRLTPARRFPVIQEPRATDHIGDVALSPDGRFLYVASLFRNSAVVLNALTGFPVSEIATGRRPYRIVFAPDGKTFYVSHWADGSVGQYNTADGSRLATIVVGPHPTDMVYLPGKNEPADDNLVFVARLFVSCANSNSVTVLGISEGNQARMLERVNVASTGLPAAGTTPSGLSLSPDGGRLLVACSGNNAVAVVDVEEYDAEVVEFVPTGWYPTAVRATPDGRLFITNGRSHSLSVVAPGSSLALNPIHPPPTWSPPPIRHVIYILKGNQTYDQILGDVGRGDSDPSRVLFGEDVTPNHHKLAREFVLLDNFYVNGDTAPTGYHWSTAAIAGDYVEKMAPSYAAGRRKVDDFEGAEPAAFPPAGYLWTNLISAGLTLRNYGFQVENNRQLTAVAQVRDSTLDHHTNKNYLGPDPTYSDQKRADEFLRDFGEMVEKGNLPRLLMVRLENDRASGKPASHSAVADNDYALGRIVETVSRSPVWGQTAIFVLESDARNGSDHVHAQRTPAFVASPYSRRGVVDSTHYTTVSVLRTMEIILGLRPMTQFDGLATPMSACFAARPDLTPYVAEKPRVSLEAGSPAAPRP